MTVDPGTVPPPPDDDLRSEALRHRVTERIRQRHPSASPALVEQCVDDAFRHFRHARIHSYLPVLLERWASSALEQRPDPGAS